MRHVDNGECGKSGGIGAQDARADVDGMEAQRGEEVAFVGNPTAFGADGEESARIGERGVEEWRGVAGMQKETVVVLGDDGEFVLKEGFEALDDPDLGKEGVTGLGESLDQAVTKVMGFEDMGVEIATFDACGVGEEEAVDAEGGDLWEEAVEDLGTGKSEEKVDRRAFRHRARGEAEEDLRFDGEESAVVQGAVEEAEEEGVAGLGAEDAADVGGAWSGEAEGVVVDLVGFKKNPVHSVRHRGRGRGPSRVWGRGPGWIRDVGRRNG